MTNKIVAEFTYADRQQKIGIIDPNRLMTDYVSHVFYYHEDWDADYDISEKLKQFRHYADKIDEVIGKLTGIPNYDACNKFSTLADCTFDKSGIFKGHHNKYETLLWETKEYWLKHYPVRNMYCVGGTARTTEIPINEITSDVRNWLDFKTAMDNANDYLADRTIFLQRTLKDIEDQKIQDQKLLLKPSIDNEFMRTVWDLLNVEMTLKMQGEAEKTDSVTNLINSKPSFSSFIETELVRWNGVEMPKLAGKARSLIAINPLNYKSTFEGRAASNNNVISMIAWLKDCKTDDASIRKFQNSLIRFLLKLQSNTENACIRDAISYATIGISQILTSAYEGGKLIATWADVSMGVDDKVKDVIGQVNALMELKSKSLDAQIRMEMLRLFLTGLCLIFSKPILNDWDSKTIEELLRHSMLASKK